VCALKASLQHAEAERCIASAVRNIDALSKNVTPNHHKNITLVCISDDSDSHCCHLLCVANLLSSHTELIGVRENVQHVSSWRARVDSQHQCNAIQSHAAINISVVAKLCDEKFNGGSVAVAMLYA
jgi:hypothetical protein